MSYRLKSEEKPSMRFSNILPDDFKSVQAKESPKRLIRTARNSIVFLNNDIFKDVPKGYIDYEGKFVSCNELFADVLGVSQDEIRNYDVLAIAKFDSFEGPQTAAYTFNNLANQYLASSSTTNFSPPEFDWAAPLGLTRKGLIDKRLNVSVVSERVEVDGKYVLSVYLKPSTKISKMSDNKPACKSYGSMSELEVMESASSKKFEILVIDSSLTTLQTVEKQINDVGHKVDTEQNGFEALQALKKYSYDIVLVEVGLDATGIVGMEVAHEWRIFERLHRHNSKPLILIAMSSEYEDSLFMEAMNSGFDGFLIKPFVVSDFLSVALMISDERKK